MLYVYERCPKVICTVRTKEGEKLGKKRKSKTKEHRFRSRKKSDNKDRVRDNASEIYMTGKLGGTREELG